MKLKRLLLSIVVMGSLAGGFAMTDQQVIAYIKQQVAAGKSQQQIGKELMAKGVTPEQAERIKATYEAQEKSDKSNKSNRSNRTNSSNRSDRNNNSDRAGSSDNSNKSVTSQSVEEMRAQRQHNSSDDLSTDVIFEINNEILKGEGDEYEEELPEREIYGHKVFNNQSLTFEPSGNLATPQNYRLGPGDEVIIDIWGTSEDHLREIISPEGSIMIEQVGPVYLNGMTIKDANSHIKNAFSRKYAGVKDAETDIQVTLGQVRSIQVDLMGEVAVPGTYRMSPFSTVFHALYRAGGINDIGTLRNIQVLRNGKRIAGVDIYDYLFNGKTVGNIRLEEGDVIIVPPYEALVNVTGNVKRPMYYEVKPNESLETVIDYAGGFTGDAYSDMVRVARQAGTENELYNVEHGDFSAYKLKDGDEVSVGMILDRYTNRVELKGSVFRPGMFAIGDGLNTVGQLIAKADGVTEDAFLGRALLYREGPNLELQVMALDLAGILNGSSADVDLKKNDVIVISSIHELQERGEFTISGQVAQPGVYPYAENFTLEDLIFRAGGLLEGASTARVDISRRIVDPAATTQSQQISKLYSVSIENGLAVGQGKGFVLQPYDVVQVRKSPGYAPQEIVTMDGEVLFAGEYTLEKRNERVTEVIKRAGGLVDGAYVRGAYLTRKLSDDEFASRQAALQLAMTNSGPNMGDSIVLSKIEVSHDYNVGIDLEKALQNPGSHYDVILEPGDRLFIPQQQSTVKISGDVMFPNAVVYEPGKKLKHYIEQAGGYGQTAKKNHAYIVYMNGTVAKAKGNTVIEPGCQIIVPSKPKNSGTDWSKILAFATSFSSVAAVGATIANIVK